MRIKGFTLIELMVVIAIIGIVIAIILGNFQDREQQQKNGDCIYYQNCEETK